MALDILLDRTRTFTGLGTHSITVPASGVYNIRVALSDNSPSGANVLVKLNNTTAYTSAVLSSTQLHLEFSFALQCAAADTLSVVVQSSSAIDTELNTVKSTILIGQGN